MKILYDYAMQLVGKPYKWGGDNPLQGYDCSGLCVEILQSAGVVTEDLSAQGLYDFLVNRGEWGVTRLGALAFFGKSETEVTHVGFCLDKHRMLEAAGTGSQAFVKVRPIMYRRDYIATIMPYYRIITETRNPYGN